MEWAAALLPAIAIAVVTILKGLYGTSDPQGRTVEHARPDLEVADGKTDQERLADLGL